MTAPLLAVENLVVEYPVAHGVFRALDTVSFAVDKGSTLAVVGESGCGKSTLAKSLVRLITPTSGHITFDGVDIAKLSDRALRPFRSRIQMVFQDPYGSLDPRQTVTRIVAEPLTAIGHVDRPEQRARVAAVLKQVGLRDADMDKFPHEFSGGQRQRIAIARALITQPKLIVADEPVSALDVSVQAQVLNLLEDLQDEFGLSYVLISHDLAVVEYLCDEIAVIYLGRIVEQGAPEDLLNQAAHPYTRALLEAVPRARPGRQRRRGTPAVASQSVGATGCAYAGRCPFADAHCTAVAPVARSVGPGHTAACHHAETIMALPTLAGEA